MTLPLRERDIEAYLVKRVKELGGEVRKVRWVGHRGAPDRIVMLPSRDAEGPDEFGFPMTYGPMTLWVELKAPGKKPEPHQLREHKRLRAMNQRVAVIDSIEGVERMLA